MNLKTTTLSVSISKVLLCLSCSETMMAVILADGTIEMMVDMENVLFVKDNQWIIAMKPQVKSLIQILFLKQMKISDTLSI